MDLSDIESLIQKMNTSRKQETQYLLHRHNKQHGIILEEIEDVHNMVKKFMSKQEREEVAKMKCREDLVGMSYLKVRGLNEK